VWANSGQLYIACRDNFKEVKVSLHSTGRWRMGFTAQAIANRPDLVKANENRAWEVWNEPPATVPNVVVAYHFIFPTAALAIHPEDRKLSDWNKVIFIEAGQVGKALTVVTLLITNDGTDLLRGTRPSFLLASLPVGNGRYAQLMAHAEPEGSIPGVISDGLIASRELATRQGIELPSNAYTYLHGKWSDGARFVTCAPMSMLDTTKN
jgi:hypothetical protein